MDKATRGQVIEELEALRAEVKSSTREDSARDRELLGHVDHLHQLVNATKDAAPEAGLAQSVSQKLLAWEAEHPRLVALAARVAHALEDTGL